MSLADDLATEQRRQMPGAVDDWIAQWYPTLSKEDQTTFDRAVVDPRQSAADLYRVCKNRGYRGGDSTFRKWVADRRESR